MNYLSIFVAAVAAWLFGAIYYTALGKPWMHAQGKDPEQCRAEMAGKSKLVMIGAVRSCLHRRVHHGMGALRACWCT